MSTFTSTFPFSSRVTVYCILSCNYNNLIVELSAMVSQVERKDNQGPRQNKRRSLKPWMFQYIKPVEIPEELLKSIVASGLQKPQSRSRLVTVEGQTKTITKREENFNERIRNLTFMPTEKQTEEFHRHGFTTVAVLFTLFYPVF